MDGSTSRSIRFRSHFQLFTCPWRMDKSALLDQLCADADRNFRNTLRGDIEAHRAEHPGDLLLAGEVFFQELVKNKPRLPTAANHSKKGERALNPIAENQSVVLVPPGDDQAKRWRRG